MVKINKCLVVDRCMPSVLCFENAVDVSQTPLLKNTLICIIEVFPVYLPGCFWTGKKIILHNGLTEALNRTQWLRGRALDFRLREPGFESCTAVLKTLGTFFHSTLLQFTQLYK